MLPTAATTENALLQMSVIEALGSGLGQAAALQVLIVQVCNGDMQRLATVTAQVASVRSITALLLTPAGGRFTDRFGRKPSLLMGRLVGGAGGGGLLWKLYLLLHPQKTVRSYVLWQLALAVLSCISGASIASQSALDDSLGRKPALGAAANARINAWASAVGLVAPLLGTLLPEPIGLVANAACHVCCLPIVVLMRESVPSSISTHGLKSQRSTLDPIRNAALLFGKGRRLTRMVVANIIYQVSNGNNQNIQTMALDQLQWTPRDLSYFSSFQSCAVMLSQGMLLPWLLQRGGVRKTFLLGSYGSIGSQLLMSQCWRPRGGRHVHTALAYCTAEGLRATVGMASPGTLRALLVDAALRDCPGVGLAELNASVNAITSMCGVVMPLAWASAFRLFGQWGRERWWYSPGGTFLVAAACRLVVQGLVLGSLDAC